MAITFHKQPLKFFDVNEPVIFEFSSDEDLGANPNDLVADLELKSLYTSRRYVIKNILPKYGTGIYRVDVSGYLKALLLDNFEFDFNSSNKQFSIEAFEVGVSVHAENPNDPFSAEYVFDSGYVFDTTFVFAELVPSDTDSNTFYPIMGVSQLAEAVKVQKDETKINILAPKFVEFAPGFNETLSLFVADLVDAPGSIVDVNGVTSSIPVILGVATAPITDAQIAQMDLPTAIATTLDNSAIPVFGISYQEDLCENTVVFRYYTSYGGYCYFHAPKEATTASRGKTSFINNNFYNAQELKSAQRQRDVDYKESFSVTGIKPLELRETYLELLRSAKVEVLLERGYTECEVSGSMNLRKLDFEYSLNVNTANVNQIGL